MNILLVSFDRALVGKLKEALKGYNVTDVKNVEEALNVASPFVDVVIYDAVSGSISEEEINQLYKQKYKDPKYIVLVDDLFPVDMNNLLPSKKVKLIRDEAAKKIREALFKEPEEVTESTGMALQERGPSLEGLFPPSEAEGSPEEESSVGFRELPFSFEKELQTAKKTYNKLLIVSFDTEILKNIKEALSNRVQITEIRTLKEAMEKAKDADIIIFDTISGMLAYRTLMDMSRDENLKRKPYILLMDELFTIDVDSIPLPEKYTFMRTTELNKAIKKIVEIIERAPAQPLPSPEVENIARDLLKDLVSTQGKTTQEEPVKDIFEGILSDKGTLQEETYTGLFEEKLVPQEKPQKGFLTEAAEERGIVQEKLTQKEPQMALPAQVINVEDVKSLIEQVIKEQLSQEKLYSMLSQVINAQDLKVYVSNLIEKRVQEALSSINIAQIIREEAYKVLKERLRELIT